MANASNIVIPGIGLGAFIGGIAAVGDTQFSHFVSIFEALKVGGIEGIVLGFTDKAFFSRNWKSASLITADFALTYAGAYTVVKYAAYLSQTFS